MTAGPPEQDKSKLTDLHIEAAIQHFAAIGQVAATSALLETFLDTLALELADITSEAGLCFTAQIAGSARKMDAYIAVARFRGAKKIVPDLEKFAKVTAALAERRNRIVHDPWSVEQGQTPERMEVTARRILRSQMVPVSTDDILKLVADIRAHIFNLLEIDDQIRSEIGASPGTRQ